jgi:hypothetical protein
MGETVTAKYVGATPGADASTYTIFSSVTAFPGANMCAGLGLKRLFVTIDNPQAGTLKLYRSSDGPNGIARGTNWVQVDEQAVVASSSSAVTEYDALILGFPDFKLDWTNGGVAQTGWTITISLDDERAPSA